MKEINAQLIECLEQLYDREQELEDQKMIISNYDKTLGDIRQQMVVCYHDFARRKKEFDSKIEQLQKENSVSVEENQDLKLKLRRLQEMITLLQKEDPDTMQSKLHELTRKVSRVLLV